MPESDSNPISTQPGGELSFVRNVDLGAVTGNHADLMRASLTLDWDVVARFLPTRYEPRRQPHTTGNIVGVDPNRKTLAATVIDSRGGEIAYEHFANAKAGHTEAVGWATTRGPIER